uniref:Uncharacterized protein n=1 Tax=Arundo donax TaxID=35708 RepID=A0A0A9GB69_ARUDO
MLGPCICYPMQQQPPTIQQPRE